MVKYVKSIMTILHKLKEKKIFDYIKQICERFHFKISSVFHVQSHRCFDIDIHLR
jgi:hypothetical protein